MDEGEGRLHPLVAQIREEFSQLRRGQHALVDQGATRQAREVDAPLRTGSADFVLDALAHDVDPALQGLVSQAVAGQEHLAERRLYRSGGRADHRIVDRHLTPTEHPQTLAHRDLLHRVGTFVGAVVVRRQESDTRGVGPFGGQGEAHDLAQEAIRDLNEDPGAVARVDFAARRPPMLEGAESVDTTSHDPVAPQPLHVHHEAHATGVVFEGRVVEALGDATPGRHRQSDRPERP